MSKPTTTITKYQNGNCTVEIFSDGTKVREYEDAPLPEYPESMDVKITNYCDAGCAFCHEMSTVEGKHGDLLGLGITLFKELPAGIELAIGGGNPLSHPDLLPFLKQMKESGKICNITVNNFHLKRYLPVIKSLQKSQLIRGLGVSYNRAMRNDIELVKDDNTVIHLIIGVHDLADLEFLCSKYENVKVLLLGYKTFGRGKTFAAAQQKAIDARIYEWYTKLPRFFNRQGLVLSFDNLAIEQLKVERFFKKDDWQTFYMGDDGHFSMYVDLVKKEYACASFSEARKPINNSISPLFKNL